MKDFDDENLEFDDDLPELDLSDLDFLDEESTKESKHTQLKKYEEDLDDSEDLAELIKAEAFKALDVPEEPLKVPSKYSLDEDDDDAEYFDYTEDDFDEDDGSKKYKHLGLKIVLGIILFFMAAAAFLVFTKPGRNILTKLAGIWIHDNVNKYVEDDPYWYYPTGVDKDKTGTATIIPLEDPTPTDEEAVKVVTKNRSEDYVKTYLLFGIEEIGGAANTDAILLLSVNTKDKRIKLTSLLRDTYVDIPGYYPNKINSVYAHGMKTGETTEEKKMNGGHLLMEVISDTYDIDITGFACVNFNSLEKIVDRLGGLDLELGGTEADYLRRTNYISNPAYRTVVKGWNHMNGNQVLGYCRVRKVATLGGAANDYGRTLRHRRVINAVVQQYKSLSLTDMYFVLQDILGYVVTDLTQEQISELLSDVVENKIFDMDQMRLPADELFRDSGKKGVFNGKYNVTYAIVLDKYREENIKKFHEFVFLDGQEPETTGEADSSGEPVPSGTVTPIATPVASPTAAQAQGQ